MTQNNILSLAPAREVDHANAWCIVDLSSVIRRVLARAFKTELTHSFIHLFTTRFNVFVLPRVTLSFIPSYYSFNPHHL